MIRIILFIVAFTTAFGPELRAEELRIGIRTDAKPFVYKENEVLRGFLFEICDAAIRISGLDHRFVEIEAGNRFKGLGTDNTFDMLCDPATVTLERAGQYQFSPILFVSGGSYLFLATQKRSDTVYRAGLERAKSLAAKGKLVSHSGLRLIAGEGGDPPRFENGEIDAQNNLQQTADRCDTLQGSDKLGSIRVGVIEGSTAPEILNNALKLGRQVIPRSIWDTVCYVEFPNHIDGIKELCTGETEDASQDAGNGLPLSYYFGDRDIIVSYLSQAKEILGIECEGVEASDKFYSVEPYAIVYSDRISPSKIILFQKALLETFTTIRNEETRDSRPWKTTLPFKLFDTYFEGKRPSQTLLSLFKSMIVPTN